MNMSDDVVSVTLSVTQTAAQTGGHAVDKTIDMIAKLMDTLMNDSKQCAAERAAKQAAKQEAKETKPKDIKPGTVSMKELVRNARQTGDTLSTAEQGMTKADRQFIAKKAKEYGIPVAFTGSKGKDNFYASVRTSDLPVFRQICTEMMQTKMAERPKSLDNFKVNEWEVPFLTAEMKPLGVAASFGKTSMKYLTGEKKLDGVKFLRLDTSTVGTGEVFLTEAHNAKTAQFIMQDNKVYLNPMFKGAGALQGFGKPVTDDAFKQGVGKMFDYPALAAGLKYTVEDMRPATVEPKGEGFSIVNKGSVDVRLMDSEKILRTPALKLPEFPKSELPLFRR